MNTGYPAVVKEVRGGFVVTFPDWPEIVTEGSTFLEAVEKAEEALTLCIETRLTAEEDLPAVRSPNASGRVMVYPASRIQSAMLFSANRGELRRATLGKLLGTTAWSRVVELERGANITFDRADRAAKVLGYRLVLTYVPEPEAPVSARTPHSTPLRGGRHDS